jgi:signal transduction histidine kinase
MVLLAHDDPALRRVCHALLEQAGWTVCLLTGARDLARALRGVAPEALVCGWTQSWASAEELIGAARERSPSVRVLLLGSAPLPQALKLGVHAAVEEDLEGLSRLPEALSVSRTAAGLLDAAGVAAFRLDPQGELLQANATFEQLGALDQVREAVAEESVDRRLRVGSAWYQLTARPAGEGVDGLLVDISEAERLGRELAELRYDQQSKPAAGAIPSEPPDAEGLLYAHTVAHDLQAPLRSALLLLEQDADDLAPVAAQLRSMQRLVRNLLPDVEDEPTLLQGTAAEDVLDEALANLGALIHDKGAQIEREPLPEVGLPPTELLQLLQNLVGNALRYGQDPPVVHVSAERRGEQVVFSVRDNGPGISREDAERLFQAWQKGPTGGHGLGLAICKRLVEQRGGWIAVDSGAGGSTFQFAVPSHE